MKRLLIFVIVLVSLLNCNRTLAQEYYPHRIYAQVKEECLVAQKDSVIEVRSRSLDSLINVLCIKSIKRPFYFAKTKFLQQVYEFHFDIETDSVFSVFSKHNDLFGDVEYIYKPEELYDPADYMWQHTVQDSITNDYLWSLVKINAAQAWDITKGDSDLKIAVIDTGFDYNHPDLYTKIYPPYDFYIHEQIPTTAAHGTKVASILAAETVDQGEIPLGDMASIGYNTRIMVGNWTLPTCLYASTELKAKLLSISWRGSCYPTTIMLQIEKEILDNGTIIVRAAGNGSAQCNGGRLYPFSGYEDPRVIVVSSTDFNDYHYNSNGETYSHYPEVDICAPGYSVMSATRSTDAYGNPISWPYYGFSGGTSFAAPLVSGVCALVLSLNPCFAPEDVQDIIKNSADPIADADDYPGLVGAGRVNAYQALLLAQTYLIPDTITTSTTWNQKKHIYSDVIIDSLATLTITDTLYIAGGSRLIVRPGGKLIVNGGTLTNACEGEMWQGIIVEGNPSLPQYAQRQGSVILNNATVENARNAISTHTADSAIWIGTGGIVQATNTLFHNNRRTAEFLEYENHYGSNVTDNTSRFTRCTFIVDDDNLFASNGTSFLEHVSLWRVRGVKFNGCDFQNQDTTHSYVNRGRALYTADAGYRCRRICPVVSDTDPCACQPSGSQPVVRCSFTGFYKAIESTGDCGQGSIVIDNCDFANNFVGIALNASDNAQVSYNHFNLDFSQKGNSGLRLASSTGFTVEDNDFVRMLTTQDTIYGIICDNTGNAENFIRRNDFSNLFYGCYSLKNNGPIANRPRGLQFNCNSYTANTYDIYVPANSTIRNVQGSLTAGADNDFSNTITRSLTIPMTMNTLSYYYSSGNSHIPVGTSNYTGYGTATANPCASTLCGLQNPGFPPGIIRYASLSEEYELLSDEFERRGYGAILSDRGHYTDSEVRDAMAAESRLDSLSVEMAELSNRGIKAVIQDSVMDFSQLKDWFGAVNTLSAKYLLVETHYLTRDYAAANWLLSALPDMFDMSEGEQEEYGNYRAFHALRNALAGNTLQSGGVSDRRTWAELTEPELAELQRIAEGTQGRTATMAQGILCFFYRICYEEDMVLNLGDIGERALLGGRTRCVPTDNGLVIYPNPTGSTLTMESASPIREITVYDLSGRVMMTANGGIVETCHGASLQQQYTLNVSSLHSGIYLLRVVTASGVETGRFVKN